MASGATVWGGEIGSGPDAVWRFTRRLTMVLFFLRRRRVPLLMKLRRRATQCTSGGLLSNIEGQLRRRTRALGFFFGEFVFSVKGFRFKILVVHSLVYLFVF